MEPETRSCQNCKNDFTIDPEDFQFYEKISHLNGKMPPPTFCPDCRLQRRLSFRSSRHLYKRNVEFSGKEVFSPLPPESPLRVVDEKWWWSDKWNPMDYGRDYDFNKPFLKQLRELQLDVPVSHRRVFNGINSDYCENAVDIKNCYLCFNAGFTENSLYSESINGSKECVDMLKVEKCELSYELFNCQKCFQCIFSNHCVDCVDVSFSINLTGCSNCFGCVNLRNKKYHIFNKPHSKEDYFKIIGEHDFGSARTVEELRARVKKMAMDFPVKYLRGHMNVNSSGDYLDHCKNTRKSFYSCDLQDCAHCQLILFAKSSDCMDISIAGGEMCYELEEAGGYGVRFSWICIPSSSLKLAGFSNLQYCMYCFGAGSSNLFGCVGLRDKQYCILNKQYTKKDYEELVPKIIKHMNEMPFTDSNGLVYKYGEFFPPEFSPIPYNATWAQDYFPLEKKEALEQKKYWRDPEPKSHSVTKKPEDLPDNIKDVADSILNDVIGCANGNDAAALECIGAFKIIPRELEFYRRMNLPVPRLCPNCRHYKRAEERNPLKLWPGKCQCAGVKSENGVYKNQAKHPHNNGHCPNEFETSYAPDRPEIVYCEQCYNNEVA